MAYPSPWFILSTIKNSGREEKSREKSINHSPEFELKPRHSLVSGGRGQRATIPSCVSGNTQMREIVFWGAQLLYKDQLWPYVDVLLDPKGHLMNDKLDKNFSSLELSVFFGDYKVRSKKRYIKHNFWS